MNFQAAVSTLYKIQYPDDIIYHKANIVLIGNRNKYVVPDYKTILIFKRKYRLNGLIKISIILISAFNCNRIAYLYIEHSFILNNRKSMKMIVRSMVLCSHRWK